MDANSQDGSSIELKTDSGKPVRLRAPVVIAGGSVIAAVILLTVVLAFSPNEHEVQWKEFEVAVAGVSASTNEPLVMLPEDYDKIPPLSLSDIDELRPLPVMHADPEFIKEHEESRRLEEKALASDVFFDRQTVSAGKPSSLSASALPEIGKGTGPGADYGDDLPPEDRQNLQDQKLAFLNQFRGGDNFVLNDRLHEPLSAFEIKAGTLISAVLVTAINSDLPGDVIAQVTEHVYDSITGSFLLIPQGSKLYGRYDSVVSYRQERVLVAWRRLVLPNGKSINLEGMIAADPRGSSGLEDQVDHHFMQLAGAVLLSTAISLSGNLGDNDGGYRDDVGNTVAQEASRVGQRIVAKNLNVQPTLKIRGGAEVRVFVNKDMILEPYEE